MDADGKQKNKHTFFVDSAKEGKSHIPENFNWHSRDLYLCGSHRRLSLFSVFSVQLFDLADHLQTAPELVNRVYNRPTLETLETKRVQGDLNPQSIMVCVCTHLGF